MEGPSCQREEGWKEESPCWWNWAELRCHLSSWWLLVCYGPRSHTKPPPSVLGQLPPLVQPVVARQKQEADHVRHLLDPKVVGCPWANHRGEPQARSSHMAASKREMAICHSQRYSSPWYNRGWAGGGIWTQNEQVSMQFVRNIVNALSHQFVKQVIRD